MEAGGCPSTKPSPKKLLREEVVDKRFRDSRVKRTGRNTPSNKKRKHFSKEKYCDQWQTVKDAYVYLWPPDMPDYKNISEEFLLHHLRLGDDAAFTEIYNRYWERLLAVGYFYTKDKQAAEDIVHEVMMGLWARRSDVVIQSLSAYLGTAVKFAVFKSIVRDRRRRDLLQHVGQTEFAEDIEKKLDARFLADLMQGEIETLPEKTRLVFIYSREEELSVKEIANKMDLSPKAVEYHITKALKTLRDSLKKIKSFFI